MTDMPEPPDLTFVITGNGWPYQLWWHDEHGARIAGYDEPGRHWWDAALEDGGEDGPVTWEHVRNQPYPQLVTLTELN